MHWDRITSLDALGFDWAITERKTKKSFEQRMDDLRAYKEKNGHVNVKEKEDKSLYQFCCNMRRARNNPGNITTLINDDRIASLDALGFEWTVQEWGAKSFEQRLEDLRLYKDKHGHIRVKWNEDKSLYSFCSHMRNARDNPDKSTTLINDDRVASLDALGFEWSNSGIKSFSQQTDQPQPNKKRKLRGQGKVDTATKKKHINPKWSAKNDKGCAASSDQMEASVTAKDEVSLSDPILNLGGRHFLPYEDDGVKVN